MTTTGLSFFVAIILLTAPTASYAGSGLASPASPNMAAVGNGLSSPIYVNLYWDANWDLDNASMPKAVLDAFTTTVLKSSYFGGLAEYGVGTPSYGGGFLPQSTLCPQKAPSRVGFYDPFNTSIIGFLQCELQHGGIPQGPQVVYNIILPVGSLESDFFGADTVCGGGPAVAWHFHQTPYSPEAVVGIVAALLGASTGGIPGALEALVGALTALQGGPLYTIESADPACGNFTDNLLHEMVEAASDPFPPPSVVLSGSGEIADNCAGTGTPPTHPFVPPLAVSVLPANSFTTAATIAVPQYWSNAGQHCVTGFTDTTPAPVPLKATTTGNGASLIFTIPGKGFGKLPAGTSGTTLPYIAVQDDTQRWQAGNSLNSDSVGLNLSWTDTGISINGFDFSGGNLVIKPGDHLSIWVCNPSSGLCGAGSIPALAESGLPQLNVFVFDGQNVNLLFDVKIDNDVAANGLGNGGSTAWVTLSSGSHAVSETPTTQGFFTEVFRGQCDKDGNVTLNPGDNQICSIVNMAGSCPSGQHCCGTLSTVYGCLSGCVPITTACQPLCAPGLNKCCGEPLPTGRCDDRCIKSPPAVCP